MENFRTPIAITISVWKALFLREAVSRILTGRAAWFWLLVEPVIHIVVMMYFFSAIHIHKVGGINTAFWLMIGMLAFLMFRRTATQTQNAVASNKGLFTYRQVMPVDAALVRASLEGFLTVLSAIILFSGAALVGIETLPRNPLSVVEAFFGLWLLGMGWGLMASVASELIPEVGKVIGFAMTPLYFASGAMFPISTIPQPYRGWIMLNPVAHGLEAARLGFVPFYRAVPELSILYIYGFSLVTIFLGLTLHVRFKTRLIAL